MRLLCAGERNIRAITIQHLPPLPIIVDYPFGAWTATREERMVSALAHPDRVRGIALRVPRPIPKGLLAAMNQPFPSLDSLELHCLPTLDLNSPPPFLTVQPLHLRRLNLTLSSDASASSCHFLSCTTSLVDLTLCLDTLFLSSFETQLLSHIQGMTLLRRLRLNIWGGSHTSDTTSDPPCRTKGVFLPKLDFLCFTGHITQLEGLMACLVAPSLQALRITLPDTSPLLLAPHLSKFLRGKSLSCAQISASREGIKLFMVTCTQPPFKFIVNASTSLELLGHVFRATLGRVKVVFLTSPFIPMDPPRLAAHVRWRLFFEAFRSVKTLRISPAPGIESNVLDIFYLGDGNYSLKILPALQEIELNATMHPELPTQIDEDWRAYVLGRFQQLVDAREKKGHAVNVHWNTDLVHPMYFHDSDADM